MSLEGKKILVTGASGFIGNHLVAALSDVGAARIVALSRSGKFISGAEGISLDLSDKAAIGAFAASREFDVIYNLAGRIDQGVTTGIYEEQLNSNTLTAIRLADAFEGRVGKFIQIGSNAEYGDAPCPQQPYGITQPCSAYGVTKLAASEAILAKARSTGFPGMVARPFLVYGEGQNPNSFLGKALSLAAKGAAFPTTLGEQTRDFTPVHKVTDELIELAVSAFRAGSIVNLCTGVPIELKTVLNMIQRLKPLFIPNYGAVPYRSTELMESAGVAFHPWSSEQCIDELADFIRKSL